MLNDLAARDTSTALARRLRRYTNPALLLVDEIGYLSYDSRAADLLFEVVSRRHEQRPIILTTNKPFAEWNEVFPNSSSVTALVDRLLHRAEIVKIEGESYRAKEAKERAAHKARQRAARSKKAKEPRLWPGSRPSLLPDPISSDSPPAASAGSRIVCSATAGSPDWAPKEHPCWSCLLWPPIDTAPRSTVASAWLKDSA
jgi:hypothetical protein